MRLASLPAFQDNDLWFLHDGQRARVMDPGEAHPVPASLQREGLELEAILVTHPAPGHAGGVDALPAATAAKLRGPAREDVPKMARGLQKSAFFPGETRVCGTHEYTLSNLKFAWAVEPGNLNLIHYRQRREELRADGLPTLPCPVGLGKQNKPFLRTREPAVVQAAQGHDAAAGPDEVGVFATLRAWKNGFR